MKPNCFNVKSSAAATRSKTADGNNLLVCEKYSKEEQGQCAVVTFMTLNCGILVD